MSAEKDFTITLNIAGQTFNPVINRQDEELYRRAEKEINEAYKAYTNKYDMSETQLLRLLILQFAVSKVRSSRALQSLLSNLDDLSLDLEEFIEH